MYLVSLLILFKKCCLNRYNLIITKCQIILYIYSHGTLEKKLKEPVYERQYFYGDSRRSGDVNIATAVDKIFTDYILERYILILIYVCRKTDLIVSK